MSKFERILTASIIFLIVLIIGQGIYYKIKSDRQETKIDNLKVQIKDIEEKKYIIEQESIDNIIISLNKTIAEKNADVIKHTDKAIAALKKANAISYNTNVSLEECPEELVKCDEQNSHLRDTVIEKEATNEALSKIVSVTEEKSNNNLNKFNICEDQLKKMREDWNTEQLDNEKLKGKVSLYKSVAIGAGTAAILIAIVNIFTK